MAEALDPQVNGEGAINEAEIPEPEEKPAFDIINIDENKLKYLNNTYKKVNAIMYGPDCDIRVTVGPKHFKAHRKVLAEASDYFSAMFSHDMKEQEEFNVDLKEISPEGFSAMLDYFYHGHVTVDKKILPDILEAARFFHVEWILDVSCDFMIRHLSILDFPLVMHLADKFSLGDLRWNIFKYFGQNLPMLVERHGFYHDLCVDLLMQFLMEGTYVDLPEFNVLELVLNWVNTDKEKRQAELVPLLRQIRFHTMELEELEDLPKVVLENKEIVSEIEDAKCYCLDVAGQCLKTDEKYLPRGARTSIMISTFNDVDEANMVVYKDPYDEHSSLFVEQLGHSGFGVQYNYANQAQIGNYLFAAGGYELEFTSSPRVFRYNAQDREWMEMAVMNKARVSHGICNSKDRLFVVGGVCHSLAETETGAREEILSSAEMYKPEDNEWKMLPSLPHGVFDVAVAHTNNTLFASGGVSSDQSQPIPLKFMYSLADGATEWSTLPPMLEARRDHSMTPHKNKLYVIGGFTAGESESGFVDCEKNEVYDIETKQWSHIAAVPNNCERLYHNVGLLDNIIYYLCSRDSETYLGHYDIDKDEFKEPLVLIGEGQHKIAVLQISYPSTS